jgi:hypothetical protein
VPVCVFAFAPPDGRPDLQGVWTNATLTPLERPKQLADRQFLTEDEARALEAQAGGRQATADDAGARAQALTKGDIGSYNQFWFDSGTTILPTGRHHPSSIRRMDARPSAPRPRGVAMTRSRAAPTSPSS